MGTPTNRTPVRVARGSTTALNTGLSDIQEGEIVWDTTLNKLQVKEGSALEDHITNSSGLAQLAGATFTGAVTFPSPNVSNGPLTFKTTDGGSGYVGMDLSYYQHVNFGGLSSNRCNVFDITSGGDTQFLIPDDSTKLTITTTSWAGSTRPADTGRLAEFTGNGAVELYYDGTKKFETTTDGVNITGKVDTDGIDNSNQFNIKPGGEFFKFENTSAWHLNYDDSGSGSGWSYAIDATKDYVRLYGPGTSGSTVVLETKTGGVDVTGTLDVSGAITSTANASTHTLGGTLEVGGPTGTDNGVIKLKTRPFNITANSSGIGGSEAAGYTTYNTIIQSGTEDLFVNVGASTVFVVRGSVSSTQGNQGTEELARFTPGAGVELLYNNSKKLETTADGVEVFGHAHPATTTTLTDGASISVDLALNNNFHVTLGGNRTLVPTNQHAGQSGSIFVKQDGTGSRTLAYHADFKWPGGTAPTLSTAAGAEDRIDYIISPFGSGTMHAVITLDVK